LFVGRTLEGHVWAYRHDLPADLVAALEPILRAEPIPSEPGQPLRYLNPIRTLMGLGSSEWSGPAYALPAAIPDLHGAEVVAPDDLACLAPHFGWLIAAYDGRAVAAARLQPLYSTSWDNLGSQGVARRLGLRLYGEDWSIW
jgi:hypothetical protein